VAETLLAEGRSYYTSVTFHAQQAAEKYLKAVLVYHQAAFPRTHDIGMLLRLVRAVEPTIALAPTSAVALNPYGVAVRYPGSGPEPDLSEAREAVALAADVRDAVARVLGLSVRAARAMSVEARAASGVRLTGGSLKRANGT